MTLSDLKISDIGRKVVYRDRSGFKIEEGIITSMNNQFVFVRYGHETISKATRPQDLEWCSELPEPSRSSHFS